MLYLCLRLPRHANHHTPPRSLSSSSSCSQIGVDVVQRLESVPLVSFAGHTLDCNGARSTTMEGANLTNITGNDMHMDGNTTNNNSTGSSNASVSNRNESSTPLTALPTQASWNASACECLEVGADLNFFYFTANDTTMLVCPDPTTPTPTTTEGSTTPATTTPTACVDGVVGEGQ